MSQLLLPIVLGVGLAALPTPDVLDAAQPTPPARKPRKVALLVGPSEYLHDFTPLKYTADDVTALAAEFRTAGFDEVVTLTDPPEGKNPATRKNILDRLEKLVSKQPAESDNIRQGDVVVVVLSGHGQELEVPDPAKKGATRWEAFFAPTDGRKGKSETLVSIGQLVNDVLAPCGGRNLVLVDACRDTYQPNRGKGVGAESVSLTGSSAVLFSCSVRERSWEAEGVKHGVFTHAVLEVFGEARKSGKGLSWSGLVARVEEKMSSGGFKALLPEAVTQTPVLTAGQVPPTALLSVPTPGSLALRTEEYAWDDKKLTRKVLVIEIGDGERVELVLIDPAARPDRGTFTMGSPRGEKGRAEGKDAEETGRTETQHEVKLTKPYYLGKFEVTRGQFRAFIAATGHKTEIERGKVILGDVQRSYPTSDKYNWKETAFEQTDRHPVVCVTYRDAEAFCQWVNKLVQRAELSRVVEHKVSALGFPTEAQWEYACRGGTKTPFYWGDELEKHTNYENLAGADDGYKYTAPVGSFRPNPLGLHDLLGNVMEYCQDMPGDYADVPKGPNPLRMNEKDQRLRVVRGGDFTNGGGELVLWGRSAARWSTSVTGHCTVYNGFRVCLPAE